jgi:hypothetical protein
MDQDRIPRVKVLVCRPQVYRDRFLEPGVATSLDEESAVRRAVVKAVRIVGELSPRGQRFYTILPLKPNQSYDEC